MPSVSKEYSILPDSVERISDVTEISPGVWQVTTPGDVHIQTQEWYDRFTPSVNGTILTYDESGLQVCYARRGKLTDNDANNRP